MARKKQPKADRRAVTKWLGDLLMRDVFHVPSDTRHYWASEVTLENRLYEPGKTPEIRVDFVQFKPVNKTPGGIDRGEFTFFEIKSCRADFDSEHGHNLFGDRNYYVMTRELYEELHEEDPYLKQLEPFMRYGAKAGVYVPVTPKDSKISAREWDGFYRDNAPQMCLPNPLADGTRDMTRLECVFKGQRNLRRPYSNSEMLFAMLRSAGRDRACYDREYWQQQPMPTIRLQDMGPSGQLLPAGQNVLCPKKRDCSI